MSAMGMQFSSSKGAKTHSNADCKSSSSFVKWSTSTLLEVAAVVQSSAALCVCACVYANVMRVEEGCCAPKAVKPNSKRVVTKDSTSSKHKTVGNAERCKECDKWTRLHVKRCGVRESKSGSGVIVLGRYVNREEPADLGVRECGDRAIEVRREFGDAAKRGKVKDTVQ